MAVNALLIAGSFAVFALFHSVTAGDRLKNWLAVRLGEPSIHATYRAAYNVLAGLTLLPSLALVWLLPDRVLYRIEPPWMYLALIILVSSIVALLVSLVETGLLDFLGISQLLQLGSAQRRAEQVTPLQVGGLYRLVRHPLYLFSLVAMWSIPIMTFNLLVLVIASSLYLLLGSRIEERRLERAYGESYREYRRQVPWLIPWPRPSGKRVHDSPLDVNPPKG